MTANQTQIEQRQIFRVEVRSRLPQTDDQTLKIAHQLGITNLTDCRIRRLFFLYGELSEDDVQRISLDLLADPVTERSSTSNSLMPEVAITGEFDAVETDAHTIDVTFLPGVTDAAGENLVRAAHLLGIMGLERAASGKRYLLSGDLTGDDLERLATEVCSNPVIQRYAIDAVISAPFVPYQMADETTEVIVLRGLNDEALLAVSADRRLSLDVYEMRAIRDYFTSIERDPTDAELEMLAQTWSEHCVHKTFKALVEYSGPDGEIQQIDGLLKTYIRAATEKVNKVWVVSAFVDNAGIIRFDDHYDLAFKVETHNRPSAIEPFGGANTGVGGVVRDVLGVSARPIANTDILCFGMPNTPHDELPAGVLHPRRIADGVIGGIEDYGNKMGIPTVNGAIHYHQGYIANPLVFCGCLGVLPRGAHPNNPQAGDLIVVIGGRTGRDGLRGATFSSMEMDTTTSTVSGGAVQIGNPITEKQVQEVVLRARDEKLYSAITDCGAGGLSSAVGEMAKHLGAQVQLADVPLKYPGLRPWEIWLSEAQERMVLAVPPTNWERFKQICEGQDVEAVAFGVFEQSGHLYVNYGNQRIVDLAMDFLHDGIPQMQLKAMWEAPQSEPHSTYPEDSNSDFAEMLLKMLAHPTVRSKETVIRRYDHEVQSGTAVKPLVGVDNHGPGDAAVLVPQNTIRVGEGFKSSPAPDGHELVKAVALSVGLCPQYTEHDPYAMAWAAVDEAFRNLVAVGADPDQVAMLDNFCWGNTRLPDRLGSLVRAAQGCYDAAIAYNAPFVSGKDSLNNEYLGADGERHAIPGTLVISAVGIVPDVRKTVTMDLKQAGNPLYVIGETRDEMGGSLYNEINGLQGGTVPQPNPKALDTLRALHQAIQAGLVCSCHDVSEGGIAVALAEMCIAGRLGVQITTQTDISEFFSESLSRFIVEVSDDQRVTFEQLFAGIPINYIGEVFEDAVFSVVNDVVELLNISVTDLERAWRGEQPAPPPAELVPSTDLKRDTVSVHAVHTHTRPPLVLILHANGSNRDHDAYLACQLAGGDPEIVHVNQLINGERNLLNYHMLIIPGGFSYGDDLGAGALWALDLRHRLKGIDKFIADGRPVLGICNGFQTLVKAGLLPGVDWQQSALDTGEFDPEGKTRTVTLTYNQMGQFECRWVYLQPNRYSNCLFTDGLTDPIYCPVAHGEGRVAVRDEKTRYELWSQGLAPLLYVNADGSRAAYPANPNGSVHNIAGLCNPAGNVFGLMPHPENHIFDWQHPRRHRGEHGMDGLRLFKNGILRA